MPLEPDAAKLLEAIRTAGSPLALTTPAAARQQYDQARANVASPPPPVGRVRNITIPGPGGAPLALRLYRPDQGDEPLPTLLYFHGGGWVLGNLESHDSVCRALTLRSGFAVLSVDYRLAPEHRFPAAIEDAEAALAWVLAEGRNNGIDPTRLAVGGDSAGGNIAAAFTILDRDSGHPRIGFQLLIYPAVDFGLDTPSQHAFAEGHLLTRANQVWFHEQYLRSEADRADWRVSPLRVPDVAGLPAAFILTAEYDPLRDEAEAYAERLRQAAVPVTLWRVPGQIHGFVAMGRVIAGSATALQRLGDALAASPVAR